LREDWTAAKRERKRGLENVRGRRRKRTSRRRERIVSNLPQT